MTEVEIREQLKHWCDNLGLDNWSFKIELVHADDVENDAFSEIYINVEKCEATVYLARHRSNKQQVSSIVHELVHIVLHPMWLLVKSTDIADRFARAEEKAVKQLTNALYN